MEGEKAEEGAEERGEKGRRGERGERDGGRTTCRDNLTLIDSFTHVVRWPSWRLQKKRQYW